MPSMHRKEGVIQNTGERGISKLQEREGHSDIRTGALNFAKEMFIYVDSISYFAFLRTFSRSPFPTNTFLFFFCYFK